MKRHLERGLPESRSQDAVKHLLHQKIRHYEKVASALINDESSDKTYKSAQSNSRSTMIGCECFHGERSSNWTVGGTTSGISCLTDDSALVNETAQLANTKLAHALDLDEMGNVQAAVQAYMDASDIFLCAIKSGQDLHKKGNKNIEPLLKVLKRRLLQALDRVEQLKHVKDNRKK
jgi:hypothetical protein